ncbi:MAG TPA: NADH-quinone oxidoreductase subunit A [bacterium]
MNPALWPLALYAALAVLVAAGMLGVSALLGQRHMERGTGTPYESGIVSARRSESGFNVRYYLVAMLFLIFDVESVFIFAWAVALREAGWPGFAAIAWFNLVLLAMLAYLWRSGAFAWSDRVPGRYPRPPARRPAEDRR